MDSSWLTEVDKFLRGEENAMKEHPYYANYDFDYKDKSYPTEEKAYDLFHAPVVKPKLF